MYNEQYVISIDHPKKEAQGGNLHEGHSVGLSGSSPLRSDGSWNISAGRLDCIGSSQRCSKTKLSSRGATRLKYTQIRWFS
jgi:hypothetical protein